MKIAFLSRGTNVYDRRFLEKMVERGHRPFLISYHPTQLEPIKGAELLHFPINRVLRFPRLTSIQIALHLRSLLKRVEPDILHTGWVEDLGFYGALSGFHPTLSMPWGSDILVVPEQSLISRLITQFTLKRADRITCDCSLVKGRIIALSGCSSDKIVTFPWGIDLSTFSPRPSAIRQRLGWAQNEILIMNRSFKRVYGIEYFIEALPAVVEARPNTRVILAGAGPLGTSYRASIERLGLQKYVHFAGWLDDSSMAQHLNASDVYVTTSLSDGTSCSMLEAMGCGLPVIVSDAPAYLEWVMDGVNGFIVPRRDPGVLAGKLIELLGNASLRNTMGARNLEIARERADWEKNFDILEGIYRGLVAA